MDSPNIIFIVVDTLRKDYAKPLEDELRKLGFISYENAIAPASWTLPSHVSMFTGLYPSLHKVHETRTKKHVKLRVNKRLQTILISNVLKNLDFSTYLITANAFVSPYFGINGFLETYDIMGFNGMLSTNTVKVLREIKGKQKVDMLVKLVTSGKYHALIELLLKYPMYLYYKKTSWPLDKGAKYAIRKVSHVLDIHSEKSLMKFIFINLMEVHEPYFKNEGNIDRNFIMNIRTGKLDLNLIHKWKQKYPEEVRYVTKKILELMRILKEKNAFDNSLIIITSDHGQLLGEHGRISHGTFLHDELLKVPLLIKYPEGYEVEHVQDKTGYISLVRIKPFILNLVDNKLIDDSILYSDIVFAESYGIHQNVGEPSNEEEKKNIEQLEKYRIAIYYKNFKGIFNVTDWKFEKIKSYDPNIEVTDDIVKRMRKEVVKFLKTATITKIPRIKI